jgi:uncharacterized membrane protein
MLPKIRWLLRRTLRQTWVRVVSFAVLAIATVVATRLLGPLIPSAWAERIGAEAVDQVLGILASSMLAVATFSLSVAVSAFAAAASNATPRATRLLQEDRTTQNVLATFLGAFIFGLVGIILLKAGYYGEGGVLVLYVATVVVVVLVVAALLRWISHLMSFGRMGDTLDRVERATADALRTRLAMPYLGGRPWTTPSEGVTPVPSAEVGYVQYVDMSALQEVATRLGCSLWVEAMPGQFVHHASPLLHAPLQEGIPEEEATALRGAFTCANERTFDQDPRFGVTVLAEIASRALSPAVNDPGTAISVIGRLVRVLSAWHAPMTPEVEYPALFVRPLDATDLMVEGFRPIARDGARMVEVQCQLQEALAGLAARAPAVFGDAALAMSAEAITRADHAEIHPDDKVRIRASADRVPRAFRPLEHAT